MRVKLGFVFVESRICLFIAALLLLTFSGTNTPAARGGGGGKGDGGGGGGGVLRQRDDGASGFAAQICFLSLPTENAQTVVRENGGGGGW